VKCRRADKNSSTSEWTDERRREQSERVSGSNNANYGKLWTEEQKIAGSKLKKEQYHNNAEYRYKVGSSNRGVKFSKGRIKAMHAHRPRESYIRSHDKETREKIGQASRKKWTNEYKKDHRKRMEDLGYWVPIKDADPYDLYYKESNWVSGMIDYLTDAEVARVNIEGLFSAKNSKGTVRDHIVPRMTGYEFNLPVEIIRHPSNLQLVSHSENISKGFQDRRLTINEKEHTIHLLVERIINFKNKWKEQEKCLQLITSGQVPLRR
jgi:hypothetical protein